MHCLLDFLSLMDTKVVHEQGKLIISLLFMSKLVKKINERAAIDREWFYYKAF
jgi:hypothetical protein